MRCITVDRWRSSPFTEYSKSTVLLLLLMKVKRDNKVPSLTRDWLGIVEEGSGRESGEDKRFRFSLEKELGFFSDGPVLFRDKLVTLSVLFLPINTVEFNVIVTLF